MRNVFPKDVKNIVDTLARLSTIFHKGDNFYDFLFGFTSNPFWRGIYSRGPTGSTFFPFREVFFQEDKTILTVALPKMYSFIHSFIHPLIDTKHDLSTYGNMESFNCNFWVLENVGQFVMEQSNKWTFMAIPYATISVDTFFTLRYVVNLNGLKGTVCHWASTTSISPGYQWT